MTGLRLSQDKALVQLAHLSKKLKKKKKSILVCSLRQNNGTDIFNMLEVCQCKLTIRLTEKIFHLKQLKHAF